jgi:hypothetical protein
MTAEEREKLTQLCILIQSEKDPVRFTALVQELNALLEKKEQRFIEDQSKDPLL